MKNPKILLAALLALLPIALAAAETKAVPPAKGKAAPGAVALVGDRRVEEADIRRAALVMERDPLRTRQGGAWRKKLLDLCVNRELLALEAERGGVSNDAVVKHRIDLATTELLYGAIRDRVLMPRITPSASQIDTARAGGLFRRAKLSYILTVGDKQATYELFQLLKNGANFDSVAALDSTHPSASKGGEVGWRRVGELNPRSWHEFKTAKPGDLLGPYPNYQSHELYKVEAIAEPSDSDIRDAMIRDRVLQLDRSYQTDLLQKYHFKLDPEAATHAIFTSATESVDSILASLDSEGRRSKRGVHPSLGVLARVDGDSITYRDLAYPEILRPREDGKAEVKDSQDLSMVCTIAFLPRLIARDARELGIDRDPMIARQIRLIREEFSTRAMVARAVPALDSAAVRAYYDAHAGRYQRPAARRAFVAAFASEDTARMADFGWNQRAFRDSVLAVDGFRPTTGGTVRALYPRLYGEISLFDTDTDSLSVAVRGLAEGQITPLIVTPNGYALAQAMGREPARALTFEEARRDAAVDAREDAENTWVVKELERLRAATPARAVPGRLDAVRLGVSSKTGGNRR
jgi:parvulin-like peptidyl-prolyl cis-trans isomerase-like protein/PPIC-type peptidyl-prolyl cis-trans isomerase-like protein